MLTRFFHLKHKDPGGHSLDSLVAATQTETASRLEPRKRCPSPLSEKPLVSVGSSLFRKDQWGAVTYESVLKTPGPLSTVLLGVRSRTELTS